MNANATLLAACKDGFGEAIALALAHGADPNAKGRLGMRPLHFCVKKGNATDGIERLIAAGADIDALDNVGRSPLLYACQQNKAKSALALIEAGARFSARDAGGRSCLDLALQRAQHKAWDEIVVQLLAKGVQTIWDGSLRAIPRLDDIRVTFYACQLRGGPKAKAWAESRLTPKMTPLSNNDISFMARRCDYDLVQRMLALGAPNDKEVGVAGSAYESALARCSGDEPGVAAWWKLLLDADIEKPGAKLWTYAAEGCSPMALALAKKRGIEVDPEDRHEILEKALVSAKLLDKDSAQVVESISMLMAEGFKANPGACWIYDQACETARGNKAALGLEGAGFGPDANERVARIHGVIAAMLVAEGLRESVLKKPDVLRRSRSL